MTRESMRSNAVVLAMIGVLCIGVSDRPTSLSALLGGTLLLAAGAIALVSRRLPSRSDDLLDLDDEEMARWRSLAEVEGTVTAVKRLRQTYPGLGLVDAVHLVNGDSSDSRS